MGNRIDLSGLTFDRWTVLRFVGRAGGKTYWWCRCACGTERAVNGAELRYGKSTNCGCVRRNGVAARNTTHGQTHTREYVVWCGMIARCENPKHASFHRYGGRGIAVCQRWRDSFAAFLEDVDQPPTPKHTIDRIDNDGPYEPGNCRWATNKENCRNGRRAIQLEYNGKTLPLNEWAERCGLEPKTVYARIRKFGWSVHLALTTPATVGVVHGLPALPE